MRDCADALYRGTENQLYRVEIHSGTNNDGKSIPTFKWSRDNGAIAFLLRSLLPSGDAGSWTAKLADFGRDNTRFGLDVGDWVEVLDANSSKAEASDLDNPSSDEARDLLLVASLNPTDMSVTLVRPVDSSQEIVGVPPDADLSYDEASTRILRPYLRRWDQKKGVVGKKTDSRLPLGVIPIVGPSDTYKPPLDLDALGLSPNGERQLDSTGKYADASATDKPANDPSWITLEDGIKIQFQQRPDDSDPSTPAKNSSPVSFRAGDYWLIPARTASSGMILWPNQKDENGNDLLDKQKQVIPLAKQPDGVVYHHAALAIIADSKEPTDLRSMIEPPLKGP